MDHLKETFYFAHDFNAFMDPKIRILVYEYGIAAYGAFWVIIEILASDSQHRIREDSLFGTVYPLLRGRSLTYTENDFGGRDYTDDSGEMVLAEDAGLLSMFPSTARSLLDRMLELDLLTAESGWVFSRSLNRRIEKRQRISEKKAEAGAKGGLAKANRLKELSAVAGAIADSVAKPSNKRKVKESKEKKKNNTLSVSESEGVPSWIRYREGVQPQDSDGLIWLTDEEGRKLRDELGMEEFLDLYQQMCNYALSNPTKWKKKYEDHAAVMRSWKRRRDEGGKAA